MSWEGPQKGLVIVHRDELILADCKFIVQPAGNARVRREKRKNVHAFIEGDLDPPHGLENYSYVGKIVYNPYKHRSFRVITTGEISKPILKSDGVTIIAGSIHAWCAL